MDTGGGDEGRRVFGPAELRWLRVQGARGPPSRCGWAGGSADPSAAGTGERSVRGGERKFQSSPSRSNPSEGAVRELCAPLRPPHTHLWSAQCRITQQITAAAAALQECPSPTAPYGSCTERRVRRGCSPCMLCINFSNLKRKKRLPPSSSARNLLQVMRSNGTPVNQ